MDAAADAFFKDTVKLKPSSLDSCKENLIQFVAKAQSQGLRIALITSGGTTVPLELNTVRFIDNFSTGTRGALCTQELLAASYAVIFLHRKGSNFPFATDIVRKLNEAPLRLLEEDEATTDVKPPPDLKERLLTVGFTTIFDYLFLLREACQALSSAGPSGLILLAAAVSDFYVPEREMSREKIQSRAHDGLTVQLRNVPKMLGAVREWAPNAFVLSFKLETNPNILLAKAAGALKKYKVDAVCSNVLHTIRDWVTIVEADPAAMGIDIAAAEIGGEETSEIQVKGVRSYRLPRGDARSVDVPLIATIAKMHGIKIEGQQVPSVAPATGAAPIAEVVFDTQKPKVLDVCAGAGQKRRLEE